MILNYNLNKNFTFKIKINEKSNFFKFSIGYINIFIANIFFQEVFVELLGFNHAKVQLCFTIGSGIISYIFQKKIVFK